jgi:hypothetical protein
MNHTAKTEKEKSDAESRQEKPIDSDIDIHILRNRYSECLDPGRTMSRILVTWQMRSLQETTIYYELSCELKLTE